MKLTINAIQNGEEILEKFLILLKDNNIIAAPEDCKILVTKSNGDEVAVSADKLRVVYNKE